jgi:hypothetical protein
MTETSPTETDLHHWIALGIGLHPGIYTRLFPFNRLRVQNHAMYRHVCFLNNIGEHIVSAMTVDDHELLNALALKG